MKKILFLVTLFVALFSCRKTDSPAPTPTNPPTSKVTIKGVVQKGPFLRGTRIDMTELDTSLNQTGRAFKTNILTDDGTFSIDSITLSSTYADFEANGYYFNEFSNMTSNSQLSLQAITNVTSPNININVLTHLERPRVKKLVRQGMSFVNAKKQAQREILNAFTFVNDTLHANSENLNIVTDNNDNAIMLAISIIIQGDRGVGDFTALLGGLQSDLEANGAFSARLQDSLRRSVRTLCQSGANPSLNLIDSFLVAKYQSLGVSANIPHHFRDYVSKYYLTVSAPGGGGPTNGLVGFWPFNGDSRDSSGNLYDGVATGVLLSVDRQGSPNKCYYFNGIAGTRIRTSAPGVLSDNPRTVSFWAKHSTINNSENVITWGSVGSLSNSFSVFFGKSQQNQPMIGVDFGGSVLGTMSSSISDQRWHHYVVSFSDSSGVYQNWVSIYIDGVYYSNNVIYNTIPIANTVAGLGVTIGEYNSAGSDWRTFKGSLDEVRVYSRLLNNDEVLQLASN